MIPETPPSATAGPLRILHLNSLLSGGGTDDQCLKLAQGLHRLGQEVWIVGPEGRELSQRVPELGLRFHSLPSPGPLKWRLIFSAAKLLRRERIQLIHGHHGRDLWPTILAARCSGARPKIVLTRHLAKSPSSWLTRQLLLGQCDALIAVSQFVAQVLREGVYEPESPEPERRHRPPLKGALDKIHVIHGGIDTESFRPLDALAQRQAWGLTSEDFAFGVVGGYDLPRGKGQREFLQAASRIQRQIPQARFLIVGRGNMKQILEQDVSNLGLAGKAWLTTYCHDMPRAMNALDCLVHPQVGTEAFPGVVLEAFACGKPVIASRLDGIVEAFAAGNLGQLVPPESVPDLAAAMLQRASQPPLTELASEELHARIAADFSLDVFARKVLDLYCRLVAANAA